MLDAEFSGVVKRRAAGIIRSVLNLCSIDDGSVAVRGVLRFLGGGVVKIGTQLDDVVFCCEALGALVVFPLEVDLHI